MKTTIATTVLMITALALAACNKEETKAPEAPATPAPAATPAP